MFKSTISSITDTDLYQFSDTYDSINTLTGGARRVVEDNVSVLVILSLITVLYMVVNNNNTSSEVINTIDSPAVKLGMMGLIIYISKDNPLISLVAIVIFCLTIQSLQNKKVPVIVDVEEDQQDQQDEQEQEEEQVQSGETDELDEIIDNELDNDLNREEVSNEDNGIVGADLNDTMGSSLEINDSLGMDQVQPDSMVQNDMQNVENTVDNMSENVPDLPDMNSVSSMATNQLSEFNNSDFMQGARDMAGNVQEMGQNFISNLGESNDSNLSNEMGGMSEIEGFGVSDIENYEKLN